MFNEESDSIMDQSETIENVKNIMKYQERNLPYQAMLEKMNRKLFSNEINKAKKHY